MESLSRHRELHEHIDSRSQTISSALILFSVSLACIHPQVACIFPQRSFLWLSQNICCLSMKINYRGGDYLTLSDGYCSGMLFEQLVYSSGYVMLLQFTGSEEAPERFILDMEICG